MNNSDTVLKVVEILAQSQPLLVAIILILIIVYLAPLGVFTFAILQLKDALSAISQELQEIKERIAQLVREQ
jgi:hypothetical protein